MLKTSQYTFYRHSVSDLNYIQFIHLNRIDFDVALFFDTNSVADLQENKKSAAK